MLRDAVATALTHRTCAHLAIPVDILKAPSPLQLRHFCASHANLRIKSPLLDPAVLDAASETLVGEKDKPWPRNIIAVGLRAIPSDETETLKNVSKAIMDLAEALNAPVLTRLHAKGVVDETHPLAFGVIGVHGKPGLQSAAALVSTSDRIICIGVEDETILACNLAGLQIRKIIEIEPDAVCVNTRYNAEHTIVGDILTACQELSKRVNKLTKERAHKPISKLNSLESMSEDDMNVEMREYWSYMMRSRTLDEKGNDSNNSDDPKRKLSLPQGKNMTDFFEDTDTLWADIQSKKVTKHEMIRM